MQKLEYKLSFTTPAFLGNADQKGQWRTPPFKALLRQWWRVANARQYNYDHRAMRKEEGRLFGHAWLEREKPNGGTETWASQSQIRIRIDPWDAGKLETSSWPGGPMDYVGKGQVRADVYLGYGPVTAPKRKEGRGVVIRGAIGTNEQAVLRIGCPLDEVDDLKTTLVLIQALGALGSRERNGWGSLVLEPKNQTPAIPSLMSEDDLLARVSRPWNACLDHDWPHAIGLADDGSHLIWQTRPEADWRKAMSTLARVKVAVRQIAKGFTDPKKSGAGGIHLLGYPAGVKRKLCTSGPGKNDSRLASQLRFKVVRQGNQYMGLIAHLPCGMPREFADKLDDRARSWFDDKQNHLRVWSAVHKELNATCRYWNGLEEK